MQHVNRPLAPSWNVLEAQDADEQAHNLRDWQQQYNQLSAGSFYGSIKEVTLPQLHLFREHTNQALMQQCNVQPDAIWLGFSVNQQRCRINGQDVSPLELMVRPGHCDFELVTPKDFDIYGVVLNRKALTDLAQTEGVVIEDAMLCSPRIQAKPDTLNALRLALNASIKPNQTRAAFQETILITVLELLCEGKDIPKEKPSFNRRKKVVEKVKQYISERPDEVISITQLCQMVHMSRRTLQYCFDSVLGVSPLQYIRISRLNTIRRELQQACHEDATISSIAARNGFAHAGQFAMDYKRLFNETPSQTVLRHTKA